MTAQVLPTTYTLAVDIGGTFTDLVVDTGSGLRMYKAPTTPSDPATGVLDVVAIAADSIGLTRAEILARTDLLIGTTHARNALITSRTGQTALLATLGHRRGDDYRTYHWRGAFGAPEQPESELVARDVAEGWISPHRAAEVYRVAVSTEGVVDEARTREFREGAVIDG